MCSTGAAAAAAIDSSVPNHNKPQLHDRAAVAETVAQSRFGRIVSLADLVLDHNNIVVAGPAAGAVLLVAGFVAVLG